MNHLSLDYSDRDAYYLLTGICLPSMKQAHSVLRDTCIHFSQGNCDKKFHSLPYMSMRNKKDCQKALMLLRQILSQDDTGPGMDIDEISKLIEEDVLDKNTYEMETGVRITYYIGIVIAILRDAAEIGASDISDMNLACGSIPLYIDKYGSFRKHLDQKRISVIGNMFKTGGQLTDLAQGVLSRGNVFFYSIVPPNLLVSGTKSVSDMKNYMDALDPSLWKHIRYHSAPNTITVEEQ